MSARIQQKTLQNGELAYKQRLEEQIFDHFFWGWRFLFLSNGGGREGTCGSGFTGATWRIRGWKIHIHHLFVCDNHPGINIESIRISRFQLALLEVYRTWFVLGI